MRIVCSSRFLAVCLAGVVVIGAPVALTVRSFSPSEPPLHDPDPTQRLGILRIKPTPDNTCREFDFDNTTNDLHYKGVLPCDPQGDLNSSGRLRLEAVRESFRNRP